MGRPTLAEVVAQHAPAYRAAYGGRMPASHWRALGRLEACGSEAAGRVFYQCPQCDDWRMAPASCGHRACHACGHHKSLEWEARQQARLLPVNYVLVTFTIPAEFRSVFRSHQEICYDLLFGQSAGTLRDIAADPRHLGGAVGMTGVLHTWRRDLGYHPHVHFIMPAGAWKDGAWRDGKRFAKDSDFFLEVRVLATRMRNRMMKVFQREHPDLHRALPMGAWRKRWNVQIQPVGKGDTALGYLARYVQKTAIAANRLLHSDAQGVTISWTDRQTGAQRTQKLLGHEFLRRFLQHVLPKGLTRVRHFGWLSPAAKKTYTAIKSTLEADPSRTAPPAPTPEASAADPATPGTPTPEAPPKPHKHCCPNCQVEMHFKEYWPAHKLGRGPPGYRPPPRAAPTRKAPA